VGRGGKPFLEDKVALGRHISGERKTCRPVKGRETTQHKGGGSSCCGRGRGGGGKLLGRGILVRGKQLREGKIKKKI